MDNILDVVLEYKRSLEKGDEIIEKKNVPCSGIFFNKPTFEYSILLDGYLMIKTKKIENFDDSLEEGTFICLKDSYVKRTPDYLIGIE